jgi:SAM-dependent methyltransferase
MTTYDAGPYNLDKELYGDLIQEWYARFPDGVTLTPEYAQLVQDNLLQLLVRLARYKFVARMVKKTDSVLEVGCGSGMGAIFVGQHCAHVTGIEVKSTEVEEARSVNQRNNVDFQRMDLFDLDDSLHYDVVVSLDVIEHMPVAEGEKFVGAMAQHVDPAGMIIIGTPSVYSYEYQSPQSKASHIKCYDRQELVDLVDRHFDRTLAFSMNDEVVHTGHPKMAWYYFVLGFLPKNDAKSSIERRAR